MPETYRVKTNTQLQAAIKVVEPGDCVVLQDSASYKGFTLARSGRPEAAIVICAENKLKAKLAGSAPVYLTGDYITMAGLDLAANSRVVITGKSCRVSSCRFAVAGKSIAIENEARQAVVDHNDIKCMAGPAHSAWMGVRIGLSGANDQSHWIFRNRFHDATAEGGARDNSAIQVGYGSSRDNAAGTLIEWNLFENWKGDDEVISCKTSGNTIKFNTVVNSKYLVNRMGHDNAWIANYSERSSGMRIHDKDNQVIGNVSPVIKVPAGDTNSATSNAQPKGQYFSPLRTLLRGNHALIELGKTAATKTKAAVDTRIEGHDGTIRLYKHIRTVQVEECGGPVPEAVRLTAADVGPFAPTAWPGGSPGGVLP